MKHSILIISIICFSLAIFSTVPLKAATLRHALFANLLSAHVKNGLVDYNGFKEDEAKLDRYLEEMAQVNPGQLNEADRMAFYINLYNAWTIKLVLSKYPGIQSIKDIGTIFQSPWKKKIVRLNNQVVTLDYIEHAILRPQFKDPRIHFAVNCASMSCPPLLSEPYTGESLEEQLNRATRDFINNPERNYVDNKTLYASRIFKWYADDFKDGIIPFFKSYANGGLKAKIEEHEKDLKVKFLGYDWSLNSM